MAMISRIRRTKTIFLTRLLIGDHQKRFRQSTISNSRDEVQGKARRRLQGRSPNLIDAGFRGGEKEGINIFITRRGKEEDARCIGPWSSCWSAGRTDRQLRNMRPARTACWAIC